MDYKWKWNSLRERLELAIDEGIECGFDKKPETKEGGMFHAFKEILKDMDELNANCPEVLKNACSLNYEAEYHRMLELNEQLKMKLCDMDCQHKSLETEFVRLRAQMDIVYLIFGKD